MMMKIWLGCFDGEYELPYYYSDDTKESRWTVPEEGYVVPADKVARDHVEKQVPEEQLVPLHENTHVHEERKNPTANKQIAYGYWQKRYFLFRKFDEGIRMNTTSWFSVTPETLARHQAKKLTQLCSPLSSDPEHSPVSQPAPLVVLDAFGGVGGNTIQFARMPEVSLVHSCEIAEKTSQLALLNCKVYGISSKVSILCCDVFTLLKSEKRPNEIDILFLSPPWGGQKSREEKKNFSIEHFGDLPLDTASMLVKALGVAKVVALYLPKYTNLEELEEILGRVTKEREGNYEIDIEKARLQKNYFALTVYIKTTGGDTGDVKNQFKYSEFQFHNPKRKGSRPVSPESPIIAPQDEEIQRQLEALELPSSFV